MHFLNLVPFKVKAKQVSNGSFLPYPFSVKKFKNICVCNNNAKITKVFHLHWKQSNDRIDSLGGREFQTYPGIRHREGSNIILLLGLCYHINTIRYDYITTMLLSIRSIRYNTMIKVYRFHGLRSMPIFNSFSPNDSHWNLTFIKKKSGSKWLSTTNWQFDKC